MTLKTVLVPLDAIAPHPENPRHGDVTAITESLRVNGQYRPVVVSRATNRILAGNHTWRAAAEVGMDRIAVVYVDVDEDGERRIMLADNKTAELAVYDEQELHALLTLMPDLDGTGWEAAEFQALDAVLHGDALLDDPDVAAAVDAAQAALRVVRVPLDEATWARWLAVPGDSDLERFLLLLQPYGGDAL